MPETDHGSVWTRQIALRSSTFARTSSAENCVSDQHLFEIKWDGIRVLAYVEEAGYRLVSRHGLALDGLFPELAGIGDLPPGTLLDGELVVLRRGKPDLSLVQSRHQLRSPHKIRIRAQTTPATYIVFDQLYDEYRPLLGMPLAVRRGILCSNLRFEPLWSPEDVVLLTEGGAA